MPLRTISSFFFSQLEPEVEWLEQLRLDIVRRPFQRSVSVRVRPNGIVRVTCSKTTKITHIQEFLLAHKQWVEKAQNSFGHLREKYPPKQFYPGETFLFEGRRLRLATGADEKGGRPRFYLKNDFLVFSHDLEKYSPDELKNWLRSTYKAKAKARLKVLVQEVSMQMGLQPTGLSFRSQRTRWGSCSPEGKISLNWKLIVAPPEVMRYVVVHELAHLKHPNHSKDFWSLVARYCPDYKTHRRWLHEHQYETDFLAKTSDLHL